MRFYLLFGLNLDSSGRTNSYVWTNGADFYLKERLLAVTTFPFFHGYHVEALTSMIIFFSAPPRGKVMIDYLDPTVREALLGQQKNRHRKCLARWLLRLAKSDRLHTYSQERTLKMRGHSKQNTSLFLWALTGDNCTKWALCSRQIIHSWRLCLLMVR